MEFRIAVLAGDGIGPEVTAEGVRVLEAVGEGERAMSEELGVLFVLFVLGMFVGFEVITKGPPTLHLPLMSGSNAISGIAIIGAILVAGRGTGDLSTVLGFVAIVLAMINVVGGFMVTGRMLQMFKRKPEERK